MRRSKSAKRELPLSFIKCRKGNKGPLPCACHGRFYCTERIQTTLQWSSPGKVLGVLPELESAARESIECEEVNTRTAMSRGGLKTPTNPARVLCWCPCCRLPFLGTQWSDCRCFRNFSEWDDCVNCQRPIADRVKWIATGLREMGLDVRPTAGMRDYLNTAQ